MPHRKSLIQAVKVFEGLSLVPYKDSVGVWTVGYGSTTRVIPHQIITQTEADSRLILDLDYASRQVDRLIRVPLTQNQRDALIDWVFNLGPTRLTASTLRAVINRGQLDKAPKEIRKWVYARDEHSGLMIKLPGLIHRREWEAQLFSS